MTHDGWLGQFVPLVNARLDALFTEKLAHAEHTSPAARELVDAVANLTLRGGKRLRAATVFAGMRAVDAGAGPERALYAAMSLELMQSYLLIQDDWMDGDDERRGGPAVHAALSRQHGDAHLGASLAMLAGDVACALSWETLAAAPFPAHRLREALALYASIHFDVVCGQQLDLLGHTDVALTHQLKTGSYTVRGPLCLGALLGDASSDQLIALRGFAEPLGSAFQLRDDLLSAFGSHAALGKPIGNDLRAGRNTSLVAEARASLAETDLAHFEQVFGHASASDAEVALAIAALERCGARERVEARITRADAEARAALDRGPFTGEGKEMLAELVAFLITRDG